MNKKSHFVLRFLLHSLPWLGGIALALLFNCCWVQKSFAQALSPAKVNTTQSDFPVAGLALALDNPEPRPDGSLHADKAHLTVPESLGGASVTLNDVTVKDGVVIVGAGKFDLPRISVAGLNMQLSGELSKDANNQQTITASGAFEVLSLGEKAGCKGLTVSVTLAATTVDGVRTTVLTIKPLTQMAVAPAHLPASADFLNNVAFRQASLTLDCAIPIGESGFELKSVSGTVTLTPVNNTLTVEVEVEVGTVRAVLGKTLISANGKVVLTPSPFRLALESGVKLFDKFNVASGSAEIANQRFSASINVELIVASGGVSVNSWVEPKGDPKNFHFTGSGIFEVGVPKGKIYASCKKFLSFIKYGCIRVPPRNINVANAEVQAGEFSNGAWGFKGNASVDFKLKKWSVGFYIDTEGNIKFGKVDQYNLLTPPQVAAAFAQWKQAVARGDVVAAAHINSGLHFGSITSSFPLSYTTTITDPSDIIFSAVRQGENPKLTLVAPDGTVIALDALPDNVSYSEDLSTPEEPDEIPVTQMTYYVNNAAPGNWQAVLTGEPGAGEYYSSEVFGHISEPTVQTAASTVVAGSAHIDATITWQLTAYTPNTLVSIYANSGPITETLLISAENGATTPVTISSYEGIRLADSVPTSEDDSPQSYTVNTADLPSGIYQVWLAVDDQVNDPVQVYLKEPLVIDHSNEWTPTWTPAVTVTEGYEDVGLRWSEHPSPDVDEYIVYVSHTPGAATPQQADDSFVVGSEDQFDLTGLDGESTLYIAIGAYDAPDASAKGVRAADAGQLVLSPEVKIETKPLDFTLDTAANTFNLTSNQNASLALTLASTVSPFPDPVYLYENCLQDNNGGVNTLYLPLITKGGGSVAAQIHTQAGQPCKESDGFAISFDANNVVPTADGVKVNMTIKTVNTKPGVYMIPIIAESNNTDKTLSLEVTVTAQK